MAKIQLLPAAPASKPRKKDKDSEGGTEQAQREHRAIFEAIAKRDPSAADAAARQHLTGAELARLTMMAKEGAKESQT